MRTHHVVGIWLVVQLGVAVGLLVLRDGAHTATVITVPVPYVVHERAQLVPLPVPARSEPLPAPVPATCPAVNADAPAAPDPKSLPANIGHVVTAFTDARWIAAWNDHDIYASRDGGRTFVRVLDGAEAVADVTFDCFGHVIALRGNQLGVHATGDHWQRLAWLTTEERSGPNGNLIGGGPDVIIFGGTKDDNKGRLSISSDLGETWRSHDLTPYFDERRTSGRQDRDGTIRLATAFADCMSDPMQWFEIRNEEIAEDSGYAPELDLYARGDVAYSGNHWRRRNGPREWQPIKGLGEGEIQLIRGPLPRIVAGDQIYQLVDGVAKPLRSSDATDIKAVDAAGRFWGLSGQQLVMLPAHEPPVVAGD